MIGGPPANITKWLLTRWVVRQIRRPIHQGRPGSAASAKPTCRLGRRSRRGAAVVVVQREQSASRQKQGHQDRATLARLNRQVQARHSPKGIQRVVKATCSLEISAGLVPTPMLAMPSKAHCPQPWGQRVGGVSGRPTRETKRSDPLPSPRLQRWKAPWFTGCRLPSRVVGGVWILVGPTRSFGARPRRSVAPATTGVLWKNEEGNVGSVRQAHALFVVDAE
jgi:hypothetical protein